MPAEQSPAKSPVTSRAALLYATSAEIWQPTIDRLLAQDWRVTGCGPGAAIIAERWPHPLLQAGPADVGSQLQRQEACRLASGADDWLQLFLCESPLEQSTEADLLNATAAGLETYLRTAVCIPYFLTQEVARQLIAQRGSRARQVPQQDIQQRAAVAFVTPAVAGWGPAPSRDPGLASATTSVLTRLWALRLAEQGTDVYEMRIPQSATSSTHERLAEAIVALAGGALSYATGNILAIR